MDRSLRHLSRNEGNQNLYLSFLRYSKNKTLGPKISQTKNFAKMFVKQKFCESDPSRLSPKIRSIGRDLAGGHIQTSLDLSKTQTSTFLSLVWIDPYVIYPKTKLIKNCLFREGISSETKLWGPVAPGGQLFAHYKPWCDRAKRTHLAARRKSGKSSNLKR
jgi:hypothetical protein